MDTVEVCVEAPPSCRANVKEFQQKIKQRRAAATIPGFTIGKQDLEEYLPPSVPIELCRPLDIGRDIFEEIREESRSSAEDL